jgi:integrase
MESTPSDRLPAPAAEAAVEPSGMLPDVATAIRDEVLAEIGPGLLDDLRGVLNDATFVLVLRWLSSAKRGSTATKRAYADDIARWAAWVAEATGRRPVPLLDLIDRDAVTAWVTWARSQKMAVRTQRRRLSALSSLFTYASRRGTVVANPVDFEEHAHRVGTSTDGRPIGATRVLELADVAHMRAACRAPLERLTFDLLYACGLRVSEIVGARVEHVNRDADPCRISVQRKRGKWEDKPLDAATCRHLDEYLAGRTVGPLLADENGTPLDRLQVVDITRRLARRARVANPAKVTPHVLRATAITALLNAPNSQLAEVQKWAGHVRPETTEGYWRRSNAVKRDAALTNDLFTMIDKIDALA